MNKHLSIIIITALILTFLPSIGVIQEVQAVTQILGYNNYNDASPVNCVANTYYGYNYTIPFTGTWYVTQANIRFSQASNSSISVVICYENKTIIHSEHIEVQTTGAETVTVNFSQTIQLEYNTLYWFGLVNNGTYSSGIAAIGRYIDNSNSYETPTDPTDMTYSTTTGITVWLFGTSDDPDATPTPAPLPTGGVYDTSDVNLVISTLQGYLVPLLTFLIPALILGWATRWQKWPILIGLAIGSGLTYLFLGTQYVWLVVLVIIGIASMSYSDFRNSGGGGS